MSYDSKKIEYGRRPIKIVEIDFEKCALTFGVAPCTATGSGDGKCFNTFRTCKDVPNYDGTAVSTQRYCENVSPHPVGLDAIPSLVSVSTTPGKIDLKGGLGVRSNIDMTFDDHPGSDVDVDPYLSGRTYDPLTRSTYWLKQRARNPNYQNRPVRHLSGYLEADGSYDAANFETRHYILDQMNASGGKCRATGKDPLKLVSRGKAQAPAPSTGLLSAGITSSATSLTLTPSGVGNLEYDTSGFIVIKSEVMSFTRSADVLTVVRGAKNTTAAAHDINDTVQQCLEYSGSTRGKLDFMVNDLLVNFGNVDASFIDTTVWSAEVSTYLNGLLDGIIVKPMDVDKILKELAQAMPHYLWWDERLAKVQLTALKAPPTSANVLSMDENFIKDSVRVTDATDLRRSTVFVNFGQFDPTKKLDDIDNWQQSYLRADTDSIAEYGSSEIEVINSRWISTTNKGAALQLAALIGRRFANVPRRISFSLDAKDSDVWIGQSRAVNHRDIVDDLGEQVETVFQLTEARAGQTFDYEGLEFTYGDALPDDEGVTGTDLVVISLDDDEINLRTYYDGLFPTPTASTAAKFVVEGGVDIGSNTLGVRALRTGTWPAGAAITLQLDSSAYVIGRGGRGQDGDGTPAAEAGSDAIELEHDLELINNGIIGAGGAGGAKASVTGGGGTGEAAGGAGAGRAVGVGGSSKFTGSGLILLTHGSNGTKESGGAAGRVSWNAAEPQVVVGEAGGDLGAATTAAAAGLAIKKNGYTLTQTVAGDIRGTIS